MSSNSNQPEAMGHQFGKVRTVREQGFGFIRPEGASKDVFFHRSGMAIERDFATLEAGAEIEFDVVHDDIGRRRAVNVRLV